LALPASGASETGSGGSGGIPKETLDQIEAEATRKSMAKESLEARVQRYQSRSRYRNQSASEAADTARSQFANLISRPAWDPVGVDGANEVLEYIDSFTARVRMAGGRSGVVMSTVPVRTQASDGRLQRVDLSLGDTGDGYVSRNPLVSVALGGEIGDGFVVGPSGISLTPVVEAPKAAGQRLGDKVIYPNAHTDGDWIAAPTGSG